MPTPWAKTLLCILTYTCQQLIHCSECGKKLCVSEDKDKRISVSIPAQRKLCSFSIGAFTLSYPEPSVKRWWQYQVLLARVLHLAAVGARSSEELLKVMTSNSEITAASLEKPEVFS